MVAGEGQAYLTCASENDTSVIDKNIGEDRLSLTFFDI